MKKLTSFLLSITLMLGSCPLSAMGAVEWPSDVSVESEGAVVMDADTGVILYGKNLHNPFYPASITKILTALIVVERCSLDETVAFSYNAVHNVEENSSNAALDVGDELSVKDCLYALLLRSANECANALAEHVAGSIEGFTDLMNEKARSLGCTDSNFANPSGLNDPNHYTSAYDMALITQAAFQNETFRMIDTEVYYRLPPTKWVKDGLEFNAHHQMMLKRSPQYYPGVLGGKTGYTIKAGNTLVTYASKNHMNLIVVILNGHQTHYTDTRKLLDFGFTRFQSINAAEYDTSYAMDNDLQISGLAVTNEPILAMDDQGRITIPNGVQFSDTASTISYELGKDAPANAVAEISYTYAGRPVGSAFLMVRSVEAPPAESIAETSSAGITVIAPAKAKPKLRFHIQPKALWFLAGGGALLIAAAVLRTTYHRRRDRELKSISQRRRLNRIQGDTYFSDSYHTSIPGRTFSLFHSQKKRSWFDRIFRK